MKHKNHKKRMARMLAAVFAAVTVMTLLLAACGSKTSVDSDSTKPGQTESDAKTDKPGQTESDTKTDKPEEDVKITPTAAKSVQTEKYETADFSITIPKGWQVKTGGANMSFSVAAYDPDEPRNSILYRLKLEPLLHTQEGKEDWQKTYNRGNTLVKDFADAPVLENPTTEGLFKVLLPDFTVTDRCPASSAYGTIALGDEILRATYTDSGGPVEGLFTASIVDFGSIQGWDFENNFKEIDIGYYMAYNVAIVTAAKDSFLDWSELLLKCINTLQFSDSFVAATIKASDDQVKQSQQISQNFNETMDGIMSSWENRNKSYDIMSQKQSDATLGYERVYDTETNEVYKATNGFTDVYDGKRYKPVTDDNMYAEPISGYIEKQ